MVKSIQTKKQIKFYKKIVRNNKKQGFMPELFTRKMQKNTKSALRTKDYNFLDSFFLKAGLGKLK